MIVATNNQGKVEEIKSILESDNIYSLKDKGINIDVVEDGNTFLENAQKKAKEIYNITKEEVIADDSGLCIDCLDGFPGVKTHRFLDNVSNEEKNEYIIQEVNKHDNRDASFICVIVHYDGEQFINCEGVLKGTIALERCGHNGFGFDEIFELTNGLTLAQLSSEEKNKISARYIALNKLKERLHEI